MREATPDAFAELLRIVVVKLEVLVRAIDPTVKLQPPCAGQPAPCLSGSVREAVGAGTITAAPVALGMVVFEPPSVHLDGSFQMPSPVVGTQFQVCACREEAARNSKTTGAVNNAFFITIPEQVVV